MLHIPIITVSAAHYNTDLWIGPRTIWCICFACRQSTFCCRTSCALTRRNSKPPLFSLQFLSPCPSPTGFSTLPAAFRSGTGCGRGTLSAARWQGSWSLSSSWPVRGWTPPRRPTRPVAPGPRKSVWKAKRKRIQFRRVLVRDTSTKHFIWNFHLETNQTRNCHSVLETFQRNIEKQIFSLNHNIQGS